MAKETAKKKGVERGDVISFRLPQNAPSQVVKHLSDLKQTEGKNYSRKLQEMFIKGVETTLSDVFDNVVAVSLPESLTEEQKEWLKHSNTASMLGKILHQIITQPNGINIPQVGTATLVHPMEDENSLKDDDGIVAEPVSIKESPSEPEEPSLPLSKKDEPSIPTEEPTSPVLDSDDDDDDYAINWNDIQLPGTEPADESEATTSADEDNPQDGLQRYLNSIGIVQQ